MPNSRRIGRLAPIDELPFLEFYINYVHRPSDNHPMLTPRLFALGEGDRLHSAGERTAGTRRSGRGR